MDQIFNLTRHILLNQWEHIEKINVGNFLSLFIFHITL